MSSRLNTGRTTRSRKRQKVDHDSDATLDSSIDIVPRQQTMSGTIEPEEQPQGITHAAEDKSCIHEQELKSLDGDLETMRQLITCKICQRFLTEPYGLGCGHTYCYICLDTWLVQQKKSTCPECRTIVLHQPQPSYVIREMVNLFSTKARLLPEGETREELELAANEAANKVAKDKADSGELFSGIFNPRRGHRGGQGLREAVYDEDDHVHRCPVCFHEIEDGHCTGCGEPMAGMGPWTDDEDDIDFELGADDGHDDFDDFEEAMIQRFTSEGLARRVRRGIRAIPRRVINDPEIHISSDSDDDTPDEGEGEEHDSEMDDFIDDEELSQGSPGASEVEALSHESDSGEAPQSTRAQRARNRRQSAANRPIVVDSDDDDNDDDDDDNDDDNDNDSASDVEITAVASSRQVPRRHRAAHTNATIRENIAARARELIDGSRRNITNRLARSETQSSSSGTETESEAPITGRRRRGAVPVELIDSETDDSQAEDHTSLEHAAFGFEDQTSEQSGSESHHQDESTNDEDEDEIEAFNNAYGYAHDDDVFDVSGDIDEAHDFSDLERGHDL